MHDLNANANKSPVSGKKKIPENHDSFSSFTEKKDEEICTLLLIENHLELGAFISTNLPNYKIVHSTNVIQGLQQAFNQVPDIIIINAYMQVINGYECCKKIKKDKRTSHVPVIMLIRKTLSEACTEELASEADDYLVEPFSPEELLLRVKKACNNNHRLQKTLDKEVNSYVANNNTIFPAGQMYEDAFLQKVFAVIEEKLNDCNFNVSELAEHLCMSKANLHRKLKLINCLTPGNLINNYRLQRAAQYLKEGCNSSETAYKTGFNSPAYFSKCFRKLYKLTPLEFCRKNS